MTSFFGELRRRNVVRVAVAYAIVGWLLIEVSTTVLPLFEAPDWIAQVFAFFVILGFPLALILSWAYEMTPEGIKSAADVQTSERTNKSTSQRFNIVIVGLLVLAVGFLVVDLYVVMPGTTAGTANRSASSPSAEASSERPVRRYAINLGSTERVGASGLNTIIALSPDAKRLVYSRQTEGVSRLYVRELDQFLAHALPGTEGAIDPFFSPDGEWVAFGVGLELRQVPVVGGPARTLAADRRAGTGGFWTLNGEIIYSAGGLPSGGARLHRIAAVGGTAELLDLELRLDDLTHSFPHLLPSGEHALFTIRPRGGNASDGRIALLTLETGEYRTLIEGAYNARYAPSGHIVFMRSAALWAVAFDIDGLELAGFETPVVDRVQTAGSRGNAVYAFADDGLLVYLPGIDVNPSDTAWTLVWVDRQGHEEGLDIPPRGYEHPRISPDGSKLAVSILDASNRDIWTLDLVRGTFTRLTLGAEADRWPIWMPDSERVVYWSDRDGGGFFSQAADGTGQVERLTTSAVTQIAADFSPDGSQLVFHSPAVGPGDVHILSMDGERESRVLIGAEVDEDHAALSPDGHWIAYHSDETGQDEIYVRPFPDVDDQKIRISLEGGIEPSWGPDSHELFYRSGDALMVVSTETGAVFSAGTPSVLFRGGYGLGGLTSYDVSPDGRRFLMMKDPIRTDETAGQADEQTTLAVVENWFEELNRLAPPSE